jgi:hypothetical protein
MNKIFVIAGNSREADIWIRADCDKRWAAGDSNVTLSEYVTVTNADRLRGYTNPHGRFVGNWRYRPDILDVLQTLISRTIPANITLINLFNNINQPRLSIEIDPKVLKSISMKINGGIL